MNPSPTEAPDAAGAAYRKAGRVLLGVLVAYGVLVGTHDGEFWPFSIYQMFSSAGRPWTRTLVVEAPPDLPEAARWQIATPDHLPGRVFPLDEAGLSQNDLAAFMAQPGAWDAARRERLWRLFEHALAPGRPLLIYQVRGERDGQGPPRITWTPTVFLTPDTLLLRPQTVPASLQEAER